MSVTESHGLLPSLTDTSFSYNPCDSPPGPRSQMGLDSRAAGIDSFRVTSLRASGAHSRKFAEHGLAPSAGVEPDGSLWKILEELWTGDWRKGLVLLKQAQKDADPLCDRLESICPAIADLQPLETGLWELFKLSGPLDPVTLLKHCEGSVPSEMSGDDDYGKQNREWLQDLDRLHRLRKEKSDILTDLAEKHGYNLCPPASPQGRRMPSLETAKRPNVWAVLIGINQYQNIKPLRGAVRDTEMIRQFLISDLSVPPNHIQVLVDADATRVAILSLLYGLRDNAEIQRGDAILIHYSGHGASYGADEFFRHTFGSIEAICPVDRGIEGADHGTIMDISDREINIFLTELCSVKGDNITLVLDCCFSGGVSRCSNPVPDNSPFQSRVAPPLVNSLEKMLRAAEDSRHKRLTGKSPLDEDWRPDVSSFVVLAACQDFERAWECNDGTGGDFTIALVTALKTQPLHTTTFIELIGRIGRLRRQQPCAVGTRIDNPVFHLRLEGYAIAGPGKVTREPENAGNGTLWGILSWLLTGLLY